MCLFPLKLLGGDRRVSSFFVTPRGLGSRPPFILAPNVSAGGDELFTRSSGRRALLFKEPASSQHHSSPLPPQACANLMVAVSTGASVARCCQPFLHPPTPPASPSLPCQADNRVQSSSARWQKKGSIKPHHVPSALLDRDNSIYSGKVVADQTPLLFFHCGVLLISGNVTDSSCQEAVSKSKKYQRFFKGAIIRKRSSNESVFFLQPF